MNNQDDQNQPNISLPPASTFVHGNHLNGQVTCGATPPSMTSSSGSMTQFVVGAPYTIGSPIYSSPTITSTPVGVMDENGQMYFDFMAPEGQKLEVTHTLKECSDCKGTGKYVGLTKTENCSRCGGNGKV